MARAMRKAVKASDIEAITRKYPERVMDINEQPIAAGEDVILPVAETRRLEARWRLDEAPLSGSSKSVDQS
jgi:hypothetical protein